MKIQFTPIPIEWIIDDRKLSLTYLNTHIHIEIHTCQENQANLAFTLAKNCFNLTFLWHEPETFFVFYMYTSLYTTFDLAF